ncbi:O-acetyltransferase OatA [Mycolicibacterium obuense]|uniref:O-acetyltransferase OatA n=2 Tax=Mycolicibacterium obuense TaxID=1807 RepID=A0A0J6WEP1_9MYCO|nr:O-acetyltransferase OatA [Mycolicibacterium obuense]
MVAVLTVFANHLWDWPRGGFVGVDVFFVISGFLITGNLLRDAEKRGTVSFRHFYWNRVRRIVPAATVVLLLTYAAAILVFLPFRAQQVGVDAWWAFIFMANWHFGLIGTDYFAAAQSVSPIQHYWSLSIEEQFYFVWPALIFLISLLVLRKTWSHAKRMQLAGIVMAVIVALSLGWALYQSLNDAAWAYFDTFSRVWELGVGAILATSVGLLARIPTGLRPVVSWTGLALIGASLLLINDGSAGFPAPWAMLPVAGAALVIAAGVGIEPLYQAFLRNPVSGYIGDISYSLYLVHWPVIVLLGTLMDAGWAYSVSAVAMSFGLAIASYHFLENPLRKADWSKFRDAVRDIRKRRYEGQRSTALAAIACLALLMVASIAYLQRPGAYEVPNLPPVAAAAPQQIDPSAPQPEVSTLESLRNEISTALQATEWPPLNPSMETVIEGPQATAEATQCGALDASSDSCTRGSDNAPKKVVLVGDSVGVTYAGPLWQIARISNNQIQVHSEATFGCSFVDELIDSGDAERTNACPARKQRAVDVINKTKPNIVIISNSYGIKIRNGTDFQLRPFEWAASMQNIINQFKGSTQKIVFLAPPPADIKIGDCYGNRSTVPADCISRVDDRWAGMAEAERGLAEAIGGAWIDSRQWFCADDLCPSFVGTTPTKVDLVHMSPQYGHKISPAIEKTLREAGVF